jgi:DNA helicase-2/ATP-dependent DNA helicase PcrA
MHSEIRRQARQRRVQIGLELDTPTPAETVIDACLLAMEQDRAFLPNPPFEAAHALAHFWLHSDQPPCTAANLNPAETGETPGSALSKVDGGSHAQRCEAEAAVFAAEILLPGPLAQTLFWEQALPSEAMAQILGLPVDLVEWQLAEALLLPPLSEDRAEEAKTPASAAAVLDESQQAAAEAQCGPLLLGAGPGTGKTKTLVGRCQFLTQVQGVPADKILALTFSRKAVQEMQERLRAVGVGDKKSRPWVGTFHAFGLQVLRRFGDKIGLVSEIKLLDALDAVTLLENHLSELNLTALDNLYDPAQHLGGILRQISRAKDERCSPERYAALCLAMAQAAQAEAEALAARADKVLKRDQEAVAKGLENAAKAAEVARCYSVYERLLSENGFLDFGGLIGRTIELLEAHPDVLAMLQAEYPQVLADEYQDVNRACAYLVRLLAGADAHGLWAVGDHRQSIYQFQGASPANVAAFERDYPAGRRLELSVNYRSRRPIVELFAEAAQSDGKAFAGWQAHRGDAAPGAFPAVTLAAAPDPDGQALGIAEAMQSLRAAGIPYQKQAILCRTHSQAGSLAEMLSAQDIPVLSLGPLLDRPEVKDLLCLLSLLTSQGGSALMRVVSWPEYAVPPSETLALLAQMRRDQTSLLDALQAADLHSGLKRLERHLAALDTLADDPAARLRHYLFGQSDYLRELLQNEPKPFVLMGRKLAIHQLLGLADGFDRRLVPPKSQNGPPGTVRDFLAHLRRLSAAGAAPRVAVPPEAEALDAVRLLTAHAAKGLEFPVVFVPNLAAGQFPARGRHDGIPEPPGLAGASEGQEMDEEQCLFFVALSRAKDHLILSRSETTGSERPAAPSPLLALLQPRLETTWQASASQTIVPDDLPQAADILPDYFLSDLETYGRCPRQYYYAKMLHLPGLFQDGGYPQFHGCVRRTLEWQEDVQAGGAAVSEEEFTAKFEAVWAEFGPVGHLHEEKYKASAAQMLQSAVGLSRETERKTETRTLWATLSNCRVAVRPDILRHDTADGSLVVARRMTGKPGKDDHTDKRLALYRRAAQETYPDKPLRLALHYLADGGLSVPLEAPETKQQMKWESDRLAKYEKAAHGIQLKHFSPEVGDECARCAYNLICPL